MRRRSSRRWIPAVVVGLTSAVIGCGDRSDDRPIGGDDRPAPSGSTTPTTVPEPVRTTPETTTGSTSERVPPDSTLEGTDMPPTVTPPSGSVAAAIADLADRLDIDTAVIDVISIEEVTWPDGSIGCPDPGLNYTQALIDGQRIVLGVGDRTYEYHAADGRTPFYCPPDRVRPPIVDPRV